MINASEVLDFLLPQGGWILVGNDYEGITWVDDRPRCTKSEFENGFQQLADFKAQQEAEAAAKKAAAEAKLAALGLTVDDLKALGLRGN